MSTLHDDPSLQLETVDRNASDGPLQFTYGVATNTITVGRSGAWSLRGGPVLAMHAWVIFDGSDLHVKPSGRDAFVAIDRTVVPPGAWGKVPPGATLFFGGVETRFRPLPEIAPQPSPASPKSATTTAPMKALLVVGALLLLPLSAFAASHIAPDAPVGAARAVAAAPAFTPQPASDAAGEPATSAPASIPAAMAAKPLPPALAGTPKAAVDAMASGRFADAAIHYHALAQATHDPVYELAERIAKQRAAEHQ